MTIDRSAAAVRGIQRLSGLPADRVQVTIPEAGAVRDSFAVESSGDRLSVTATSPVAALAGYAQFVRRTGAGSVSRSGVRRPDALPEGSHAAASPYRLRVAYNITVGGYTTPFFRFEEWERELDLLAASGVNAAHLTLGQEAVWLAAFQEHGYTEQELLSWIVPPSHQPWQWLNNIQHFGGGTTRGLVERRAELARRVLDRMDELGIRAILPGFSGTVPPGLDERIPGATVVPQGKWFMDIAGPVRPDWLSTETAAYQSVAASFYRAQRELFGHGGTWAVDLLHEGGKTGGVALADAARGVEEAMRRADPDYTWVVQAWAGNPRQELLDALDTSRLLVLDLVGENWKRMSAYGDTPWAYGILPNYGGRNGLYGDLAAIASAPETLFGGGTGELVGLTDMAEGVANNPVVWDLFHDLAWTTEPVDLAAWLDSWVAARYGVSGGEARAAWEVLRANAYGPWRIAESAPAPRENALSVVGTPVDAATIESLELPESAMPLPGDDQEAVEEAIALFDFYAGTDSIVAAVPSLDANQASGVGPRVLHYPAGALVPALRSLVTAAESAPRTPSLDYDLVDVARQVLADAARILLPRVKAAYGARDLAGFDAESGRFLELIRLQDRVLAGHPDFRLDTWVEAARSFGETDAERAQVVEWAKRLLTSWMDEGDALAEYSNRDWAGLVGGYYLRRWTLWFGELRKVLTGEPTTPVDWYAVADEWVREDGDSTPAGPDPLDGAREALAFVDAIG